MSLTILSVDIYGSAEAKEAALTDEHAQRIAAASRFVVSAKPCYTLPAYGPIRAATIGLLEEDVRLITALAARRKLT